MTRTILVPLDGSSVAEQGLAPACRFAKETKATLSLVRGIPYFTLDQNAQEAERGMLREAFASGDLRRCNADPRQCLVANMLGQA